MSALADVPQLTETAAVEPNDAGIQGMRIQIIIEDEVDDPRRAIGAVAMTDPARRTDPRRTDAEAAK